MCLTWAWIKRVVSWSQLKEQRKKIYFTTNDDRKRHTFWSRSTHDQRVGHLEGSVGKHVLLFFCFFLCFCCCCCCLFVFCCCCCCFFVFCFVFFCCCCFFRACWVTRGIQIHEKGVCFYLQKSDSEIEWCQNVSKNDMFLTFQPLRKGFMCVLFQTWQAREMSAWPPIQWHQK